MKIKLCRDNKGHMPYLFNFGKKYIMACPICSRECVRHFCAGDPIFVEDALDSAEDAMLSWNEGHRK